MVTNMAKINKTEILRALKADLLAAEPLKKTIDTKVQEWRNAYEGRPYGK